VWVAVVYDIFGKVRELAQAGDAAAVEYIKEVDRGSLCALCEFPKWRAPPELWSCAARVPNQKVNIMYLMRSS
jgi:hypothetical protein